MCKPSAELIDLRAFFSRNPDEELTIQDIADRYSVPIRRAYRLAQSLREDGMCETVHVVRALAQGMT